MKEQNELETVFRSWRIRPPSRRVEKRLFETPIDERSEGIHWRWGWLAPVTAAVFLIAMISQPQGISVFPGGNGPVVAMILSNQYVAAYLPGSYQPRANAIPAETFEWTNQRVLPSSIPSFPGVRGTN